jgi:hypothetical protein
MKRYKFLLITLIAAVLLAGCGDATPTASAEDAMVGVYTAVALTFNAQAGSPTAQSTSTPASAPTTTFPYSTPTLFSLATATLASSYSAAGTCYSAAYVSDVTYTDGTEIAPGESFVKTWELKNTGTCAWDEDFLLTFYSGDDMDGEDTEIGTYISSGDTVDVSVILISPDDDGTYTGYWMLADTSGNVFGERFYVQIAVSSDLSTSTPTATSTSEATSTSTPTSVPTDTITPFPTETPVPTETPTTEGTSG